MAIRGAKGASEGNRGKMLARRKGKRSTADIAAKRAANVGPDSVVNGLNDQRRCPSRGGAERTRRWRCIDRRGWASNEEASNDPPVRYVRDGARPRAPSGIKGRELKAGSCHGGIGPVSGDENRGGRR